MNYPLKFELDRRQGVLNIGYGAGSSPTFTNLTVTGVALFANGTAAAPSISFLSDTGQGWFLSSSRAAMASSGSVLMRGHNAAYGGIDVYDTVGFASSIAAAIDCQIGRSGTGLLIQCNTGNSNITLTPSGTGRGHVGDAGTGTITSTPKLAVVATMTNTLAAPHLALCNSANIAQQLMLGWDSTNGRGVVQSFWQGSGALSLHLNPLGGSVLIGTTTDSGALLQIGTESTTTLAGGAIFGTTIGLYRASTGELALDHLGGTSAILSLYNSGTRRAIMQASGTTFNLFSTGGSVVLGSNNATALTLDSSQNATFAGFVRPVNVATASAPAYAKGVIYFDTTLNKLRVGGATAFETITSV